MLWRQGDIFIESTAEIPSDAVEQSNLVLAEGEATGHRHRIAEHHTARLFAHGRQLYLNVIADEAHVVHDEHQTIPLGRGLYRVWRQREFDPLSQRRPTVVGFETESSRFVID